MFFNVNRVAHEFTKGIKGWGIYDTCQIGAREFETAYSPLDTDELVEWMYEDEDFCTSLGCGEDEYIDDFVKRIGTDNFKKAVLNELASGGLDDFISEWGAEMCPDYGYIGLESYTTFKKAEKGHQKWVNRG